MKINQFRFPKDNLYSVIASTGTIIIRGNIKKINGVPEIKFDLCECNVDGICTATEKKFMEIFKEGYLKYAEATDIGNEDNSAYETYQQLSSLIPISFLDTVEFLVEFHEHFHAWLEDEC